ncbi:MAG: glutamate-5-semialdehyde dehydrogenase [Oscillospiraceae bacterium]|nr:glutamate-5-semialdehyde dehydrogenase [Oscillospiraceae bacterium]
MTDTLQMLHTAKAACPAAAALSCEEQNAALRAMAAALRRNTAAILAANALDVEAAKEKLGPVMVDRLLLNENRVESMAAGLEALCALPSPLGRVLAKHTRADGLRIEKIAVPLGVVAIIYESRPNVTSDAAALALKSGNVCVLKSGKEAHASAAAIVDALHEGLAACGLPPALINLVQDTTRAAANTLMTADGLVDLLIPRGGGGLIRACVENATVPCIQTGQGICHIFADRSADVQQAVKIITNAKTSRPSVCNAAEVLLVHRDIAPALLPAVREALVEQRIAAGLVPVELRLDAAAAALIEGTPAGEADFDTEFLDHILAVRVVEDVQAAIAHINAHSTHHSEAILTRNTRNAALFTRQVDSAAVYVNASTRFTDGGEFGLGCEMGISTQKLHARGPMGLAELTTYKYVIKGSGHIR